jgi:hypothetical protein
MKAVDERSKRREIQTLWGAAMFSKLGSSAIAIFVLVLLFCLPLSTQEVEHAPTVEQCRADQRLWLSKMEADNSVAMADVTAKTLGAWENEMGKCQAVDPQNRHVYYSTNAEAVSAEAIRFIHFLKRHDLWEQFNDEDAAGKR